MLHVAGKHQAICQVQKSEMMSLGPQGIHVARSKPAQGSLPGAKG